MFRDELCFRENFYHSFKCLLKRETVKMQILEFLVIVCLPLWCSYISKSTLTTLEKELGVNSKNQSKYYVIPSRFIRKFFRLKKQKMLKHFVIAFYLIFCYLQLSPISFILYFFIYENKFIYMSIMFSEMIIDLFIIVYIIIVYLIFKNREHKK